MAALLILSGCGGTHQEGRVSANAPEPVALVRQMPKGQEVKLEGRMVRKCPIAGCWFYLRDSSGEIKVDLKAAGFNILDVAVGRKMMVSGKLFEQGSEKFVDATGLQY